MTFSLVACDPERREWGVAVASKFLAAGAVVPFAAAETGAVATQAAANVRFGPDALQLMAEGSSAEETLLHLIGADEGRDERQLGLVDRLGRSATYTGSACFDWAGGRSGPAFAAQGNILVSRATVDARAETFEATGGPLADRLLEALAAGQAAGGDRRGQQSAALLVVAEAGGYGGGTDRLVDLRVDDHPAPIAEIERLYELHRLSFGSTPPDEWLDVDTTLAAELRERLGQLGHASGDLALDFESWAGIENLEERVSGIERIDPVVLTELRKAT
jgi:uncharacterized Ntn-hydrolase superfamily protein